MRSMRRPPRAALRPVNRLIAAPIANSATAVAASEPSRAWRPRASRKGRRGTSAPSENDDERRAGRGPRRAEVSRVERQLLSRQRVERVGGVLDDARRHPGRVVVRQATRLVDGGQLRRLGLGVGLQLVALGGDLVLEHLALRAHRNVLARRHRERARQQAGNPRDDDGPTLAVAARRAHHAQDQPGVRDQSVVGAEDQRPQVAAGGAAVALPDLGGRRGQRVPGQHRREDGHAPHLHRRQHRPQPARAQAAHQRRHHALAQAGHEHLRHGLSLRVQALRPDVRLRLRVGRQLLEQRAMRGRRLGPGDDPVDEHRAHLLLPALVCAHAGRP